LREEYGAFHFTEKVIFFNENIGTLGLLIVIPEMKIQQLPEVVTNSQKLSPHALTL
jgi:hypothetical protein